MCLAIIGKVISIDRPVEGDSSLPGGLVEFNGTIRRRINLGLLSDVREGDYVMIHAGFAIQKVSPAQAAETEKLWDSLAEKDQDSSPEN